MSLNRSLEVRECEGLRFTCLFCNFPRDRLHIHCQFSWNILLLKHAVISIFQTTSPVVQEQRFGLNVSLHSLKLVQHGPRDSWLSEKWTCGLRAFPRIITSSWSNVLGETKGSAGRSLKSVAGQKQTKGFRNYFSNCFPDKEVCGKNHIYYISY